MFYIFVISFHIVVNNVSMSINRSNFLLTFFKATCCANTSALKNEKGQVHILQDTYFESFQIHQLAKIYCFEHTIHDIHLNVLF